MRVDSVKEILKFVIKDIQVTTWWGVIILIHLRMIIFIINIKKNVLILKL